MRKVIKISLSRSRLRMIKNPDIWKILFIKNDITRDIYSVMVMRIPRQVALVNRAITIKNRLHRTIIHLVSLIRNKQRPDTE